MRKLTLLFTLLFIFASPAQAANNDDNLELLFKTMNMDAIVDTMWTQMEAMMMDIKEQQDMTSEELKVVEKYNKQFTKIMKTDLSWQVMQEDLKQIYRQNFTDHEISQMLKFYQSPTGQSVLRTMPTVMLESMRLGQDLAKKTMPKLLENNKNMQEELAALEK